MEYAHHVGSGVIRPEDRKQIKDSVIRAMYEQTDKQLDQIKEQIQLLAKQANIIKDRIDVSELIYQSKMGFKPIVGHTYHLYSKDSEHKELFLSMIRPEEWTRGDINFVATVKLLSDLTWEVLKKNES